MKVWDAELLTAKSGIQPVTDGLMVWFDARDTFYGDTEIGSESPPIYKTSHMFDRVSGQLINIVQRSDTTGGVRQVDGFIEKLNGRMIARDTAFTNNTIANFKTVEYVVKGYTGVTVAGSIAVNNLRIFYPHASGTSNAYVSPDKLDTSKPLHILCTPTVDSDAPTIYVNGVLSSTLQSVSATIGYRISDNVFFFQYSTGSPKIGMVRIYNRALTPAEVLQNYQYELTTGRLPT